MIQELNNKCKENSVPRRRDQDRTLNAEGTNQLTYLLELVLRQAKLRSNVPEETVIGWPESCHAPVDCLSREVPMAETPSKVPEGW